VALAALTLPLLPVVYLPFIGPMFAERFLYVPSIGAALLAGFLFDHVRERIAAPRRPIATAAAAVVVAILGASTVDRNADWHDEFTHSLDVTRKVPTAYSQHLVVAYAMYFRLNQPEEGLRHYEAAFRVRPELRRLVPPGLNEFGVGFLRARDYPAAERHFELAVRFDPGYALAYNNLGIAHYEQGRVGAAIEHFRKALAVDPENRQARANLERLLGR
jgi:tetratricopeptide (TPR) repeat protein